jgi:hypothetical protein
MHDVLIVTVPLVAILAGILFNRSDMQSLRNELKAEIGGLRSEFKTELKDLRSEMNGRFDRMDVEMNARFDRIDAELRFFHGVTGKLDGRLEAVEKR